MWWHTCKVCCKSVLFLVSKHVSWDIIMNTFLFFITLLLFPFMSPGVELSSFLTLRPWTDALYEVLQVPFEVLQTFTLDEALQK